MADIKTITIDGKEVALKCTGATSILYRREFGKDLFVEFNKYAKNVSEGDDGAIPEGAIDMLEEAAYIMAKQANPSERRDFVAWLDQFNMMALVQDIAQVAEVIVEDRKTIDEAKKKSDQPQE